MKKIRGFFVFVTAAILTVCATSCGGDDEELGPHKKWVYNEDVLAKLAAQIKSDKENGKKYVVVDYRSEDAYKQGHIDGAENIPATAVNTASDDAEFCIRLKEKFPLTTRIYFYGDKDANLEYVVPGRASKIGYGQENSNVLVGGYSKWKDVSFE